MSEKFKGVTTTVFIFEYYIVIIKALCQNQHIILNKLAVSLTITVNVHHYRIFEDYREY